MSSPQESSGIPSNDGWISVKVALPARLRKVDVWTTDGNKRVIDAWLDYVDDTGDKWDYPDGTSARTGVITHWREVTAGPNQIIESAGEGTRPIPLPGGGKGGDPGRP